MNHSMVWYGDYGRTSWHYPVSRNSYSRSELDQGNRLFLLVFAKIVEFVLMVLAGLMVRRKESFGWKDPLMLAYLGLSAGIVLLFPILE